MFAQDRKQLRSMYAEAWRKQSERLPMSPLELQIAAVIELHPEYHADVASDNLDREYTPDGGQTNPFLHMGLHLGIREQVSTNRPPGIAKIHAVLSAQLGDAHAAEHRMIDCLAEALWEAQQQNRAPDEESYLERLRRLTQ
ncbi:MAG: DUF1841 family protein [Gammaproteobacteria bacterium]|nr:DUF1841 family protein [Gammaproteobacteria bacterium]MBT8110265.1 DUF1841 family protein [Gammaproteobacteria bacterium]NND48185.1 DUF1841 family protein [Woeseiaceae bacterium]NNL44968.1 DUF1841 family protein [Woeseiaceae bacterium]